MKAGFKQAATVLADEAVAKFFYATGVPFAAASSEAASYFREMVTAIQAAPSGYVPPGPHKLAGPLLESCYKHVHQEINARDAEGSLVAKYGSTYVSDGWDSVNHLPLVNSAFITGNDGGRYTGDRWIHLVTQRTLCILQR